MTENENKNENENKKENENENKKENENENMSENEVWKEIWKDIPGYEGRYQVSNTGKVKSMNYRHTGVPRIMTLRDNRGYKCVNIYNAYKKRRGYLVHRLVWEVFVGPIPEGMQVNHKDENKSNNSLKNLEIMTPKQNVNYGTGSVRSALSRGKPVAQIDIATGEILKEYPSITSAIKEYGMSVQYAVKGRIKQAYGFKWKYSCDLNNLNS